MVQPVVQQPQVVFLQPVVSRQASPAPKEAASRHRRPKKYLPILKSYPKIAPHPGDGSSSSGRGTASLSSPSSSTSSSPSSSSSSSGSKRSSSHRDHCQREKQPRSLCGSANSSSPATSLPGTPGTVSPLLQSRLSFPSTDSSASSSPARERPSPALSQSEFNSCLSFTDAASKTQTLPVPQTEKFSAEEHDHGDSDADTRRKRFCNTYNILSKSGLLDITLRTKELLRQNRRTQSDLEQLKQQTDLFLQAVCSGDTGICVKLQASLQEEDREKERERAAQTSLKAD